VGPSKRPRVREPTAESTMANGLADEGVVEVEVPEVVCSR
jgi:hypothetical protein